MFSVSALNGFASSYAAQGSALCLASALGSEICSWPFILSWNLSVAAAFWLMGDGVVSGSVRWYSLVALMRMWGTSLGWALLHW